MTRQCIESGYVACKELFFPSRLAVAFSRIPFGTFVLHVVICDIDVGLAGFFFFFRHGLLINGHG